MADIPPQQAETAALLRRLAGACPQDTHISLVFVGSDTVWKLKKAVRLSFLDFSPLEARRHFTLRELQLNKLTAPAMYRDVVPIVRTADGTLAVGDSIGTELPVVDWVLRMAPIPRGNFLDAVADAGNLSPKLLDQLADAVARFHQSLVPDSRHPVVAAMRKVIDGNMDSALDAGLPERAVRTWQSRTMAALDRIAPWLEQRSRDGFVRRAHGDLHLANLCLWDGKPVLFDALEFDEAMATIDLGYDLAFLLMDLDLRVSRSKANHVLNRYVARTGDASLTRGLPMFLSLRAMVRAHVEAKRGRPAPASRYLDASAAYLDTEPSVIVAIGGLPGSGKSTIARALAPELGNAPGALILRSDEVRKRQHGAPPEQQLPQAAYGGASSEAVFSWVFEAARRVASGGHAVIADATFVDPRHRTAIETAARSAGVPFIGLWLEAPMSVLEQRIASRQPNASDATLAVLRAVSSSDPHAGNWLAIDVSGSREATEQLVRAKLHQHVMRNRTVPC